MRKLSHVKGNDDDLFDRPDDDDDAVGSAGVADALALACLRAALPADLRRRIRCGDTIAAVVQAPGADWCDALARAARKDAMRTVSLARDGSYRRDHDPARGNDAVAADLARGRSVVGVSQDPKRFLPSTLIAVADADVHVRAPDAKVLRSLLRKSASGRIPDALPDVSTLNFHEIVACFRSGAAARDVVDRLAAVAKRKAVDRTGDGPSLQDLPWVPAGAMRWGLSLAAAVAAHRAGTAWPKDCSALFHGPPGTGKTLFASAVAKSCGLNFIATSPSEWFRNTTGLNDVVTAFMRSWDAARAARPALFFIDEIDGLPDRAKLDADRLSWWAPLLDAVLLALSGGPDSERDGLVVCAATNHPEKIDPALLRPGRIGRLIEIGPPDALGLAAVLRHHLGTALTDVDLVPAASLAPGATPAQAAQWADDVLWLARDAGRPPTLDDLLRIIAPPDDRTPADRRVAAVHEAGHCVAYREAGMQIASASIIPRGASGGETRAAGRRPEFPTRADLDAGVMILLAGRAAEEAILGAASTGAVADLAVATRALAEGHAAHGLGATLLHRSDAAGSLAYDRDLRDIVEADLSRLYAQSLALTRRRRADVERIAEALLARRFLTGDDIAALVTASGRRGRGPKARGRDA
ncbi:AAA family ATPase [Methylosinus sp. Ce-a6]|uniref:AAA family ATPase n=1 Tax=Methylosinus sp. Ce-a6 TaxID=2172005 RepID=UPI00135B9417|nr:AAA family ATPase [Methylosinus sp. Ce-a6]